MASCRASMWNGRRPDCLEVTFETWKLRYVCTYNPRSSFRRTNWTAEALKTENDELRNPQGKLQGGGHSSHAQAATQYEFPSDDILPSWFQDQTSPYAPSDHDILMQDPIDIARLAISELLTAEDQNNLYVGSFCLALACLHHHIIC